VRSFINCTVLQISLFKDNEVGGHVKLMGEEISVQGLWFCLKERDHSEDQGVDGRM
jgi:hypothetical protein